MDITFAMPVPNFLKWVLTRLYILFSFLNLFHQPIYVSVSKLTKYMELSQLPVELGGTLDYDHFAWLKTRKVSYFSIEAMT